MKRMYYFFMYLFLCIPLTLHAQEKAIAKIHYKFSHINDTAKREQPQRDEVVLYLGKKSSFYKSYSDEKVKESIAAQKLLTDYSGHMVINFSTTPIKNFYLIYPEDQKMIDIESISSSFDAYSTESPYQGQEWKIGDEIKEIGDYRCQQATTTFKGRNYIAWFTTEIPFQAGPWKLRGLPGLILSAYDEDKEVVFEYAGFDFVDPEEDIKIEVPFYVTKATKAEIAKQHNVFINDQGKYFEALNNSGKMAIANMYYGIDYAENTIDFKFDEDYKPSFVSNNPIEKVK